MKNSDVMIPRSQPLVHAISWQSLLANCVQDLDELLYETGNRRADFNPLLAEHSDFPIRVPRPYLARIEKGNPKDPLLLQVLPSALEKVAAPGYSTDPLEEQNGLAPAGVIHKYHGRVLLVLNGACAINCRYCFRRHFPYDQHQNSMQEWQQALDYIRRDSSITEVIYSGGDPLANNDQRLRQITQAIADIPHVQRLRVHTRLPIVIPQRITEPLVDWLSQSRLQTILVLHTNHPQEIDAEVVSALAKLRDHPITLLNQSVLLKGINDASHILSTLSEKLFSAGVLPYYLHVLDKVQGAAHFDLETQTSVRIVREMSAQLPGYLVPKLVREVPGEAAKMPVS